MIKVVHTADIHLDSPFAGCSLAGRAEKRDGLKKAFLSLCEYCRDNAVDILLIAGDLFDGEFVRRETVEFTAECFAMIPETHIFIAPGNHDFFSGVSPYGYCNFPDNVKIFTEENLVAVHIPEKSVCVYGYGFCGEKISGDPLADVRPENFGIVNILIGHGDLDCPSSNYYNIRVSDISSSGFDYAALGHIHKPSEMMKYGRTFCAYSGCLAGRDFGECGKRGFILAEIEKGDIKTEFISVSQESYEEISVDITGKSIPEIVSVMKERRKEFPELCHVRAILCGEREEDVADYVQLINAHISGADFEEIKDMTVGKTLFDEIADEYSLRGVFASKLRPYIESGDERTAMVARLALKYGLDALKK